MNKDWDGALSAKLLSQEATKATQSANLSLDAWCGTLLHGFTVAKKVMGIPKE